MSIGIEFRGLKAVLGQLDLFTDEAAVNAALGKACALVERSAKQKAPKDSGALRRSITSKVENLEGVVYTPLEYAPYVEYGTGLFAEDGGRQTPWAYEDEESGEWIYTRGQKPQPYMRPALDENRQEIVRIIKEGLVND